MDNDVRTRRQWLATCAGTAAGTAILAGCTADSDDSEGVPDDGGSSADAEPNGIEDDSNFGAWPMIHYNAANRLSVPHDGVDGEPEIRWTADLEGSVEAPVVYDDTAFVSHGSGQYTAVDLTAEGDTVWEHTTDGRNTPAVSEAAVYVAGNGVEALDHENGDVLWSSDHEESVESLRIYDGTIYAGLEDRVIALDEGGEELLEIETAETVQSLAIDSDRIYVRSRPDPDKDVFIMEAFNRRSGGESLWEHELFQFESWFDDRYTKTFPLVDQNIYTRDENSIVRIDGKDGDVFEIADLKDSKSRSRPTVHNNLLYIRVRNPSAFDIKSSEEVTAWEPERSPEDPFVVGGDEIYSIRNSGVTSPQVLLSMSPETGELLWEKAAPEQEESHIMVVLDGMVLLPINEPGLVAFG